MSEPIWIAIITVGGSVVVSIITFVLGPWFTEWRASRKERIAERTRKREEEAKRLIRLDRMAIEQKNRELDYAYRLADMERQNAVEWQEEANRWYDRSRYWEAQAQGGARGIRQRPPPT